MFKFAQKDTISIFTWPQKFIKQTMIGYHIWLMYSIGRWSFRNNINASFFFNATYLPSFWTGKQWDSFIFTPFKSCLARSHTGQHIMNPLTTSMKQWFNPTHTMPLNTWSPAHFAMQGKGITQMVGKKISFTVVNLGNPKLSTPGHQSQHNRRIPCLIISINKLNINIDNYKINTQYSPLCTQRIAMCG